MEKYIIVVEGIHDEERIKKVYKDAFCITTNGSEISASTLDMIKEYSLTYKILIFTDPDYPGERIRHKIKEVVPDAYELFLPKKICISKNKKKVGIEHAPLLDIKSVLDKYMSFDMKCGTISNIDLINLSLIGNENSSQLRNKISDKLNIGRPNAKTFLKRINALGITYKDLEKMIGEINEK